MHTSICTHTEWGGVFMTGFPPLPYQEECDVGNFFLTLAPHLGLFSCLLMLQWALVFFHWSASASHVHFQYTVHFTRVG